MCQTLESSEPWDMQRTGRMLSWGGLVNGPAGHLFYEQLDRFVLLGGARGVASKIAIDQLLFTPRSPLPSLSGSTACPLHLLLSPVLLQWPHQICGQP